MGITKKIIDYLEQPEYINLKKFCEKYLELSDFYWSLADEKESNGIKKAESELLSEIYVNKLPDKFQNMDSNQIQEYFHQMLINLYSSIPEAQAKLIQKEIDKHLKKNIIYANKLKLKVPKDTYLKVKDYYINYVIVKKILPYITIKADKGLNK
ncbi:MAG: hypothetical protein PHD03_03970 [Bacilli bacterium]|nr:hypothetical protein [Bacilli bacterium]MDD4407234.1 hypothetical protein [Bacilli bacterium]